MFKLNIHRSFFEGAEKSYTFKNAGKKMIVHAVTGALLSLSAEQPELLTNLLPKETLRFQFLSYFLDVASEYLGGDDFEEVTYYVDVDFDYVFYEGALVRPENLADTVIKFDLVLHRRAKGPREYPEKLIHFIMHNTPADLDDATLQDLASLKLTTKNSTNVDVLMTGYEVRDQAIYSNGYQLGVYLNFYYWADVEGTDGAQIKRGVRFFSDGREVTESLYNSLFVTIVGEEGEDE